MRRAALHPNLHPAQPRSLNLSDSLPLRILGCSFLVSLTDGISSSTRPLSSAWHTS